jgi:DNA polymerase-1
MTRYVLIDYMHLAHRCVHAEPLSATVNIGGEMRVVDTTIAAYTVKNIFSYSGKGRYYTGVCYEGGGSRRRKEYFANQKGAIKGAGYKGSRNNSNKGSFYDGISLLIQLMANGQVSQYRADGLEADDCIASLVQKIKAVDKITPIDIITNDSDLLPLVDEQVSVYMRGTRQHAEPGAPEHRLYYQVTPDTWDEYLSYSSAYRDYIIPYNSMLLFKLMRGDKADEFVGATKGYGGKKYSQLMEQMLADEVDFPTIFRYGVDFDEVMRPVLERYFTGDVDNHADEDGNPVKIVDYMKYIYHGILPYYQNLEIPKQIEPGYLQAALNPVKIKIIR